MRRPTRNHLQTLLRSWRNEEEWVTSCWVMNCRVMKKVHIKKKETQHSCSQCVVLFRNKQPATDLMPVQTSDVHRRGCLYKKRKISHFWLFSLLTDRNSPASKKFGNVMLTSICCSIDLWAKNENAVKMLTKMSTSISATFYKIKPSVWMLLQKKN